MAPRFPPSRVYAMEALKQNSTWETIATANKPEFIQAALRAGIDHPVGMCIQDAGWRNGPWLKSGGDVYEPTEFTTWRNYFQNVPHKNRLRIGISVRKTCKSVLVWGAQVLQRIAQEVRLAENRVVTAEKMATLAGVYRQAVWPEASLNESWRTLMLSQHHDCWIVPYNGPPNHTWADQVAGWLTRNTVQRSDEIIRQSATALAGETNSNAPVQLRVFNTLSMARTDLACVALPESWRGTPVVREVAGREISSQVVTNDGRRELIFAAAVPALGYTTYQLDRTDKSIPHPLPISVAKDGCMVIETDLYRLELDLVHGGTIRSLILKEQGNRQLVEAASPRRFNELRGFFFKAGNFFSTADRPARIELSRTGRCGSWFVSVANWPPMP